MFPKIVLFIVIVALLSACAAPPAETPAPSITLTATLPPAASQTSIPTSTSTPEPAPTAEEPRMEMITHNLTDGGTIDMPGFFTTIPKNADEASIYTMYKELVEKVFDYIVKAGVAWGDTLARRSGDGTPSTSNPKYKNIRLIPGFGSINGVVSIILPFHQGISQADQFQVSLATAQYNGLDGTIFGYIGKNGIDQRVFVGIKGENSLRILDDPTLSIPPRP